MGRAVTVARRRCSCRPPGMPCLKQGEVCATSTSLHVSPNFSMYK